MPEAGKASSNDSLWFRASRVTTETRRCFCATDRMMSRSISLRGPWCTTVVGGDPRLGRMLVGGKGSLASDATPPCGGIRLGFDLSPIAQFLRLAHRLLNSTLLVISVTFGKVAWTAN